MPTANVEDLTQRSHPSLRSYVGDYVGYDFSSLAPGAYLGLPSGALTFIVSIDEPLCMYDEPTSSDESADCG